MLTVSSTLDAAINAHDTTQSVALAEVVEIYAEDYQPDPVNGFEPADAEERFGMVEGLTISGLAYRREYTGRGEILLQMDKRENTVTCNFNNVPDASGDRYMATWAQENEIEGKWLVIRIYTPDSLDLADTLVRYNGRLDKPGDFSDESCSLSATQRFGQANQKMPPRKFGPNDPKGRAPNDPLFEGFRFQPVQGSLQYTTRERRQGFGGLIGLTKKITHTLQFSSHANFEAQMAVPDAFGRVQLPHIFIGTVDIGGAINFLVAFCEGPIADYASLRQLNPKFSQFTGGPPAKRYGYLGGQGPVGREQDPIGVENPALAGKIPGDGYYSRTAWIASSVIGSTPDVDEAEAPAFAAVIKGKIVPLPDGSGAFVEEGWTDNPAYIARFLLSDARYFNEGADAIDDVTCYATGQWCEDYVIDPTQGERAFVPTPDLAAHGVSFDRYNSTGLIDPRRIRMEELGTLTGDRFLSIRDDLEDFDPTDPPLTTSPRVFLRERYTCNVAVTEEVEAVKFLHETVAPTGRLFFRRSSKGKIEIHCEKPVDNTRIRAATAVGATTIPVFDVEPWRASLAQYLLIGAHQVTSEIRTVTAADYTSDGNAITLSASDSGTVTATASGATLSGGSSSVAASGTVTIAGTPGEGDTVTVSIDGIEVTYTLDGSDTTATVAAMLARIIHATPALRQFVKATWGGASVLTIAARLGVLTVNAALLNTHAAGVGSPVVAPSASAAAGSTDLTAGDYLLAYANRNAAGSTVLSPTATVTLTVDGQQIDVAALALPAGVTSRDWHVSRFADDSELVFHSNHNGSSFSITDLPAPTNDLPPVENTTAEELLRIALPFASNDQDPYPVWEASRAVALTDPQTGGDMIVLPTTSNGHKYKVTTAGTTGASEPTWPTSAGGAVASGTAVFTEFGPTILGQSGLTRSQVHKNTFRWPGGQKQSSVNQVAGTFYDSTDDFAPTPLIVNDYAHQARTRKENKKEVDLAGFDNYHQASRYLNFLLSKSREGDFFAQLSTGPRGILLEQGDVCAGSTANGGFVNLPFRAEEIGIGPPPFYTTRVVGGKYSTLMYSDRVRQHSIRLPTTLKHSVVLDTLFEIVDNPAIRPEHFGLPGVYVLVSYDEDVKGDWRGSYPWADFGADYRQLSTTPADVTAAIGIETGTPLSSPSDFSAIDTTSVLEATFENDAGLGDTITTAEMEADPYANLIIHGNEYIQYATKTVIDADLRICELTDLLRGRFGTEGYADHSAGERVATMAGALFVPLDVTNVSETFPVKLVTVNQDVADATPENLTFLGGPARPLRATDLTAVIDDGSNWQVLGLGHDYAGEAAFIVNVLDPGDGSLVRSIKALPGYYNPALLYESGGRTTTGLDKGSKHTLTGFLGNSVSGTSTLQVTAFFGSNPIEADPVTLEATWRIDADTSALTASPAFSSIGFNHEGLFYELRIYPPYSGSPVSKVEFIANGVTAFSDTAGEANLTRYRVERKMSTVRCYRNTSEVPFYTYEGAPINGLLTAQIVAGAKQTMGEVGYTTEGIGFVATYTEGEQIADFGSAQSSLRVEVYQQRTLQGVEIDGHPIDITF